MAENVATFRMKMSMGSILSASVGHDLKGPVNLIVSKIYKIIDDFDETIDISLFPFNSRPKAFFPIDQPADCSLIEDVWIIYLDITAKKDFGILI